MQQIKYFLAACQELSFTRAAKRCNVAQPSLSRAIQRLEKELDGRLFVRAVSGLRLTALGEAVRPHFEKIIQHTEFVRKKFSRGSAPEIGRQRRARSAPAYRPRARGHTRTRRANA
jgi:DNA-binding transcriptional LysR family regulator